MVHGELTLGVLEGKPYDPTSGNFVCLGEAWDYSALIYNGRYCVVVGNGF